MAGLGSWLSGEFPFVMDPEDASSADDAANNSIDESDGNLVHQQLQCLLADSEQKQVEILVRSAKAQQGRAHDSGLAELDGLACALSACGSGPVVLRRGEGSRSAGECLRSLRRSFLILRMPSPADDDYMIVDPYFREQFSLHQPTARYSALLSLLPEEFAGRPSAVRSIVELMGREIQLACITKGTSLPPWRATKSLLSKWLPCRYQDTTYRHGAQQAVSAASAEGSLSSSVPARPAHTVLGFSTPPSTGRRSEQQKRSRSLDLPASALGPVSCQKESQPPSTKARPALWQIRTVKLGKARECQVDLTALDVSASTTAV